MPPVRPPRKGDNTIVLVKFPGDLHAGHPLGPPGVGHFWARAPEAYLWVGERGLWGLVGGCSNVFKVMLRKCSFDPMCICFFYLENKF
jgi:hypothetical protein